ncbi:hypothetical protein WJX73_000258 [Symbiochloris irregularis]|uniref:SWIRM domain-containing protein n=1 Tax=Symbiochloris irregularis TaxID=706552 RepID=A0AAW1P447_9CHLO
MMQRYSANVAQLRPGQPGAPCKQQVRQQASTIAPDPGSKAREDSTTSKRALRRQERKDYAEDAARNATPSTDEDEDRPAPKRPRLAAPADEAHDEPENVTLNQQTAWELGLNAQALSEEEETLLPPGADEAAYVRVRNFVLALWRRNVSRILELSEVLNEVRPKLHGYARAAHSFLDACGYINFGVGTSMLHVHDPDSKGADSKGTVIVVGAGLAGLQCARDLRKRGFTVIVLEGHDRPGGRVYTKRLQAGGMDAVADLGGSILTGIDGNQLAVLARQLRIPLYDIDSSNVPLYTNDGKEVDAGADKKVQKISDAMLDRCRGLCDNLGAISDNIGLGTALESMWSDYAQGNAESAPPQPVSKPDPGGQQAGEQQQQEQDAKDRAEISRKALERQLLDWHFANLEFANAAELEALSLSKWDQDDPNELDGAHCFLPGGNIRLVAALAEGTPVMYNSVVTQICASREGVAVRTATHEFKGDAVVVSVPLGVLKAKSITFKPPLPPRKLEAIQRLDFGLLNKIALLFSKAFWGRVDMFGRLPMDTASRGEYYLFYSYTGVSGGPVLTALVAGKAAKAFEDRPVAENVERVMTVLRNVFGPEIPDPLQAVCTRWGKDPLARGAYSSVGVGALGAEDYNIIGESIGGRVFFAGEATNPKYPATMHGAFQSGQSQAANVAATFAKRKAEAQRQLERNDSSLSQRQLKLQPQLLERAREAAQLAACLSQVFDNPSNPPDAEFGGCAVVYGPQGTDYSLDALLRVDLGAVKGSRGKQAMPLHLVVSAMDAIRLRDVEGGDEVRLQLLATHLEVKLAGRPSLPPRTLALLHAVLRSRGTPVPQIDGGPATGALAVRGESLPQPEPPAPAPHPQVPAPAVAVPAVPLPPMMQSLLAQLGTSFVPPPLQQQQQQQPVMQHQQL